MQEVLRIDPLPDSPLEAAARFRAEYLLKVQDLLADSESVVVILAEADSRHTDWRRSTARDLAREFAPKRVNIVSSGNETRIAATCDYLKRAPGITGQYLPLS